MKALLITHVASIGLYLAAATLFCSTGSFELTAIATLSMSFNKTFDCLFGGILCLLLGVVGAASFTKACCLTQWKAPTPVAKVLTYAACQAG